MSQAIWKQPLRSEQATRHLGETIGRLLRGGEILALIGELGAGKTTLVQGVALGAGIAPEMVSSPTFTFVQEYRGFISLVHVDLYRMQHTQELDNLGLSDYFDDQNTVVIEWADRANSLFLADHLLIHLSHHTQQSRTVTLQATGPRSEALLRQISLSLTPIHDPHDT